MTEGKQPDLSGMSYAALLAVQEEAAEELANVKRWQAVIAEAIDERLGAAAKAAFEQQDKQSGTLTLPLQGGIAAKVDIDKRVEWDSEKLLAVAQTLPWERARSLFKMALAVPENTYKAIKDVAPDLAAKIDEARTVKYGTPKIKLIGESV